MEFDKMKDTLNRLEKGLKEVRVVKVSRAGAKSFEVTANVYANSFDEAIKKIEGTN